MDLKLSLNNFIVKVDRFIIGEVAMKVLTAADKVTNVGNENEPTVVLESQKLTKEELNRLVRNTLSRT